MLSAQIDADFRRDMAERFPRSAFSSLAGRSVQSRMLSPSAWRAGLPSGDAAGVEAGLEAQMGARWSGLDSQPPVRQAAMLAMAAYAAGRDVGDLLADLNMWAVVASAGGSACDPCALVDDDLRMAARAVIEAAGADHAWEGTVALAVIRKAKRSNGVMPNSHYLWLAAHDRLLWLLLDGFGRRVPSIETLGAVAHEAAEQALGRPLAKPMLGAAAGAVLRQLGCSGH